VRASVVGILVAGGLALVAAPAAAETRQFINTDQQYPTGGALNVGPSFHYPSTISVEGLDGTVTTVRVTVFLASSANADDIDMALVGPNGQAVMLMSDACGAAMSDATLVFDDGAPIFASNSACPGFQTSTYKPSNYEDPALDNLAVSGGPGPPYLNALSFLAGGSPNGAWRLFVLDDNAGAGAGFGIIGWALTLEIEPPGATDAAAPETQIGKGPKRKSKKRRARFEFTSTEPGSSFQCSLDGAGFSPCPTPFELKADRGKHKLEVRAVDVAGNADASPAAWSWKVKRR
jgi:hypothetical protein